jgi:hypothetical protein
MTATPPARFTAGDRVRSRVHRAGILPISPGDTGTVRSTGLRDFTEPYVSVVLTLRAKLCPRNGGRCMRGGR